MSLQFEWDPGKARANLKKHNVSFEEAITVFADPLARIFDDEEHTFEEHREFIIGHSQRRRVILVHFSTRAARIRLFSARRATRLERRDYEENVNF